MLFKLLADYRPKGVAVAWDSRPVERAATAESAGVVYKEGRRPMPDLLREQFPHFRPIVEAFGYRNLEFEGWEADDVIATLATRADEAGIKTCVVSTDRDAFQLVSDERLTLMMTPRGVADVHVYTPERVEARYGIRPDQIPDFIGLKGDTSDNIPGIPGIGDKTAGALVAQYGSLEEVVAHAAELRRRRARRTSPSTPARPRSSKELATMRRDLDIDCDPAGARARAARPLAAQGDVPPLRVPQPARPRRRARRRAAGGADPAVAGVEVPWREGELVFSGRVGLRGRPTTAPPSRPPTASSSGRARTRVAGELVVHDAKALRVDAADDTLLAAYLIEPGPRDVRPRRSRGRVRRRALAGARDGRGDRRARPRRRAAAPARRAAPRAARGARR